jgi:hypothetical protein
MPYPERLQDVEQRDRHAQLIMEGQSYSNCGSEVVPALVDFQAAVPRLSPAVR